MNRCKQRKCGFWNGKWCTDSFDFVREDTGEECCRYHPDAITLEEYKEAER